MTEDQEPEAKEPQNPCEGHQCDTTQLTVFNEVFKSFAKEYEKDNEKDAAQKRKHFRLECAVFAAVAAYTIISSLILIVSRDTEIRQVRAYAFPTPIGIKDFGFEKALTGGINVRTMGQTPAYKIRGEVSIGGRAYPLRPDEDFTIQITDKIQNSAFISPTSAFSFKATTEGTLNQPTIDAINDGKTFRLYIWGRVDYEDVFALIGSHSATRMMGST